MMMDEQYMQRALYLARLGEGSVRPNPLVGCVIVHQDRIIGEGYHQQYGGAHAEVNAVNAVKDKSLLCESDVYVTLEPCSHYGKTPPCADLLVKHQVARVFICNLDPNPLVAGKGVKKLKDAGIAVQSGILEEEGSWVNRRFFVQMTQRRPYVLLKWAQTADSFIARENYDSKWISNSLSRKRVHQYRTQEAGILVGTSTAAHDNPKLTARSWKGEHPVRLVLDLNGRLEPQLHLFNGEVPTVCYTYAASRVEGNCEWKQLSPTEPLVPQILQDCQERKLQSILVEGGSRLLNGFIEGGYWDEARVFTSMTTFGRGIRAAALQDAALKQQEKVQDNLLSTYIRKQ